MLRLRRTRDSDLDFVLALEHRPGQAAYIGQWSRDEHLATMARADREHWIIDSDDAPVGYLIAYDVRAAGWGAYIKRIAVTEPAQGMGRLALGAYLAHAFHTLQADSVCLLVREANVRAQRAYVASGFRRVDLTPAALADFARIVDSVSDACLVMTAGRPTGDGSARGVGNL